MTEQRPDTCPMCLRLLPGDGVIVICDVCGCVTLPVPDHAPSLTPSDGGPVYAWTGTRWVPWVQEEDGWMPF